MKKRVFSLILGIMLVFSGCENKDTDMKNNTYEKISMSEGIERMAADEDFILLDVRRADEFAAGHIPGAVNLPNEKIDTEEIASLPDKNQTIYIYCRSGNRSKQAAEKLAAQGYTNIVEFGGINDWTVETVTE